MQVRFHWVNCQIFGFKVLDFWPDLGEALSILMCLSFSLIGKIKLHCVHVASSFPTNVLMLDGLSLEHKSAIKR